MCGSEDPLFTPLLPLASVQFQAKESVHKTPFWENLLILASTASIFTQILAHNPPNFEIFSSQPPKLEIFRSQAPLFRGKCQFASPVHTWEIRAAHPYLKKSWAPPPRSMVTKTIILKEVTWALCGTDPFNSPRTQFVFWRLKNSLFSVTKEKIWVGWLLLLLLLLFFLF